jgi:hypothetical protein
MGERAVPMVLGAWLFTVALHEYQTRTPHFRKNECRLNFSRTDQGFLRCEEVSPHREGVVCKT